MPSTNCVLMLHNDDRQFLREVPVPESLMRFCSKLRNSWMDHNDRIGREKASDPGASVPARYEVNTTIPLCAINIMIKYSDFYGTPQKAPSYIDPEYKPVEVENVVRMTYNQRKLIEEFMDDCNALGHDQLVTFCALQLQINDAMRAARSGRLDPTDYAPPPECSGDVARRSDGNVAVSAYNSAKRRVMTKTNDEDEEMKE